jgi:hypothetical protein
VSIGIFCHYFGIAFLSLAPFFVHECQPPQGVLQPRAKFLSRKVTLVSHTFHAVLVHDDDGGRPNGVKTVKPGRVFFDVNLYRNEIIIDVG